MSTTVATKPALVPFQSAVRSASPKDAASLLFGVLAPLHGLEDRDAALLERAIAGRRFISAMHPFGRRERALMRIALADLCDVEALVVEVSASYVTDLAPEVEKDEWTQLGDHDLRRVMWFVAILRLAERLDAVCRVAADAIHAAWTDEILHLEVDGADLSPQDVERVLDRVAALETITGRRVLFTSSARRWSAA